MNGYQKRDNRNFNRKYNGNRSAPRENNTYIEDQEDLQEQQQWAENENYNDMDDQYKNDFQSDT